MVQANASSRKALTNFSITCFLFRSAWWSEQKSYTPIIDYSAFSDRNPLRKHYNSGQAILELYVSFADLQDAK